MADRIIIRNTGQEANLENIQATDVLNGELLLVREADKERLYCKNSVGGITPIHRITDAGDFTVELNVIEVQKADIIAGDVCAWDGNSKRFFRFVDSGATDDIKKYADNQLATIKAEYEAYGYALDSDLVNAGYSNEDEFKEDIILDYKKTLVAEDYYKENLTEDEINKYYEEEIYGEMTVKHILIKPEEDSEEAEEEALKKAKEVITKLQNGEIEWKDAVKEYSNDDASKDNEGLLSSFTKQDVSDYGEEFYEAALNLENDKYTTSPVKSSFGYHIILKVSQEEKPSLEDALDTIKENLCDNAFSEDSNLSNKLWIKIREKYNFHIEDTIISENYDVIKNNLEKED